MSDPALALLSGLPVLLCLVAAIALGVFEISEQERGTSAKHRRRLWLGFFIYPPMLLIIIAVWYRVSFETLANDGLQSALPAAVRGAFRVTVLWGMPALIALSLAILIGWKWLGTRSPLWWGATCLVGTGQVLLTLPLLFAFWISVFGL